MSLVQHVSANEGVDYEPDNESLYLGRRLSLTLSYDPIPTSVLPVVETLEPVAAYEVSAIKRFVHVLVGTLTCVFASGIVFGFAAFKSILVAEGVYQDLCSKEHRLESDIPCYLQDQKLNLTFVVASVTTNVGALLVGRTLDRFGPGVCGIISSVLLLLGSLSMAFATSLPFDAYLSGSFLLALGGCYSFVPSFHLSNAFPRLQGLILALITGAFDASAALFLGFRLVYESTNGSFGLRKFFLLYLIVPVCIFLSHVFFMPSRSYETRSELLANLEKAEDPTCDVHDSDDEINDQTQVWQVRTERAIKRKRSIASIQEVLGDQQQRQQYERRQDESKVASGVWGTLHGVPALQQIRSPWFILITLLTILQMIRFNFFISTITSQYEYLLDSVEAAKELTHFFDIALPIGGIVTVPFIGLLLDNTSTVTVMALLVLLSTVDGVLGALTTSQGGYVKVCLFVIFRPLYYSAVSDYAAKVFGFATFGTVYGTIICLSGLFTFTQSGLQALVHSVYQEDPGPINLALAAAGLIIGVFLVVYVDVKSRPAIPLYMVSNDDERRSLLSRRNSRAPMYNDESDRSSIRPHLRRANLSTVREIAESN